MIIVDLSCHDSHSFEGWFKSLAVFEEQLESGLITCPCCGSSEIRRIPSSVNMARSEKREIQQSGNPTPYRQFLSYLNSHCEDVGTDFAREARKIHYMESPERAIRGKASQSDVDSLTEEGIEVLRLPQMGNDKLN